MTVTPSAVTLPIVMGGPEFAADPPAHYAWLREHAPVGRVTLDFGAFAQDIWVVSRYADCKAMLTDPRLLRSPYGPPPGADVPEHMRLVSSATLDMKDGDEHRRLRTLVAAPFTPKRIERLGAQVRVLAEQRLDALREAGGQGPVDLRQEFALPVTYTVIADLVGVGVEDRARFQQGVTALMSGFSGSQEDWEAQIRDLVAVTRDLVARKRAEPGDDLVTGLIEAEEAGDRLDDTELVAMVFSLVTAGYETTYNLITNAVATLLDHPDQLGLLRAAPDDTALWRSALEEVARFVPPITGTRPATAVEDIEWHGQTVPAGASVIPLLAAANRDPEVFTEPDRFDITRSPNPHLGFGHGVHFCLGANLARMEARVALQVLFERHPGLTLAVDRGDLALEEMPLWTRYRELPVVLG
ncbi:MULTISPECIES: cytochrome P450 family protein [Streptomyces]|uniref:Cytochrome P450 n=1 Tax=Streptomyces lienomycini TaxID=284035 RepID=A0ABV9WP25_9ACTN|nr:MULTISPECIES: cytochrome P450 [Streptomyces]